MATNPNWSPFTSKLPPRAPISPEFAPKDMVIEGDPIGLLDNPDVPASRAPKSLGGLPARPRIQRKVRS